MRMMLKRIRLRLAALVAGEESGGVVWFHLLCATCGRPQPGMPVSDDLAARLLVGSSAVWRGAAYGCLICMTQAMMEADQKFQEKAAECFEQAFEARAAAKGASE